MAAEQVVNLFTEIANEITRVYGSPYPNVIRVLVVDDNENDVVLVRHNLGSIDRTTYIVDSVGHVDPRPLMVAGSHDCYLVDLKIGRFDGFELIQNCIRAGCRGPFVVLTGSMIPDADDTAAKVGAINFLSKEELVSPKLLDRIIRYSVKSHRVMEVMRRRIERLEEALNSFGVKPNASVN